MIRSCNRFTGECDRGCKPGWTGIHCDHGEYDILTMRIIVFEIKKDTFKNMHRVIQG